MPDTFTPAAAPLTTRPLSRIETALAARRNVLEIIPALAYRQPMVSGTMLLRWHMLADPGGLKRVLSDHAQNYPKSEIMRRMLRPAIGESLFNADGSAWKWQRQAIAPVFAHRNVVALVPAMSATAERLCTRLASKDGGADLAVETLTATFEVICDVALSGRDHFDGQSFQKAVTRYFQTAGRVSSLDFLGVPRWLPRPGEFAVRRAVTTMHSMVARAIKARCKTDSRGASDLLDRLLAAKDPETGRQMGPNDLMHNMQFFIVAGHETTALAIAWALYLLAHAPEHQEHARAEVAAQLNGRVAKAADLPNMPFITKILEESLRLYPPVGLLARNVVAEDQLCGRTVRPNDILFLPIWALHRHEMWWDKPNMFDPERFAPAHRARLDKYQYLPFGAGPRVCAGADFAMTQAQIILATLLGRFRFAPAGPEPKPVMTMTVRPEPGVNLSIVPLDRSEKFVVRRSR